MKEYNQFNEFSIEELELAYIHFAFLNDSEAIDLVSEAFCKQAILTLEI
jgi:hypothetical protein